MNLQASEIDSELGVDVGALLDKLRVHALDRDTMAIVKSDAAARQDQPPPEKGERNEEHAGLE